MIMFAWENSLFTDMGTKRRNLIIDLGLLLIFKHEYYKKMETYQRLGLTRSACGDINCKYHKYNIIDLECKSLGKLLESVEIKYEETAKTYDGFDVIITSKSAEKYYVHRLINSIPEKEKCDLMDEARKWIRSVKKTDNNEFTGYIDGIHELPYESGKTVYNPDFWYLGNVLDFVKYNYSLPTRRQAAGLCLSYDHIVLGKHFLHSHN